MFVCEGFQANPHGVLFYFGVSIAARSGKVLAGSGKKEASRLVLASNTLLISRFRRLHKPVLHSQLSSSRLYTVFLKQKQSLLKRKIGLPALCALEIF